MINIVVSKDLECGINKVINKIDKKSIKKIYFTSFGNLYDEISQIDLFNNFSNYLVFNNNWFDSLKEFNKNLDNIKLLLEQSNINIYFFINELKIDKQINEQFETIKITKVSPINLTSKKKIIIDLLKEKNKNFSNKIIDAILNNSPNSFLIINNEISKLISLSYEENISENELIESISNYEESNIFKLIEYILNKDFYNTFKTYQLLSFKNQDEMVIINILTTQLINIYYVLYYYQKYNLSSFEINKITNIQPFIINDYLSKFKNQLNNIKTMIDTLYKIDLKIKKTNIDKKIVFSNLLLTFLNL